MSSYIGRHAELYDIFYADKPYADEAAFMHQLLQQYSTGTTHRLLELACGTGTHALELEKFGYDIIGTDYSEDMLTCARSKALACSSKVKFQLQDMRSLNLEDRPFDAVVCLFDSIGYVASNAAIIQVLQGIYRHLRSNGLFIFEFWHAPAVVRSYDPLRIRCWPAADGEIMRVSNTRLDYVQQLANVTYTIHEMRHDGRYKSLKETQTNRYFSIQEMAVFLSCSGFEPLMWHAGFDPDEKITENTWHIVAVACKSQKLLEHV